MGASRTFTGAWIETYARRQSGAPFHRRTFTGAWIETPKDCYLKISMIVAPSRVRGLKQSARIHAMRGVDVAPSRVRGLKL